MSSLPSHSGMDAELGFDDTSDSSYEIISQDSYHNSDDESHDECTDSVASLPDDNREVVSTILDHDRSLTATTIPDLASGSLESTVVEESLSTPSLSSTGFGLSPLPSEPFLDLPPDWINFNESDSGLRNKNINVVHTLQESGHRQGQILPHITVNQTMSKKLLKLDKPLHIAYCGNITIKHDIIEKLAGAVAASLKVSFGKESPYSKLQIVPLSSFGCDHPNAQVTTLPSTGLEIFVSDCTEYLARGVPSDRPLEMYYEYYYPNSLKSSEHGEMPSKVLSITCRRPDLALVVHHSTNPNDISWQQSRALARLNVPVIDVNEIGYSQGSLKSTTNLQPSTPGAVHMRLRFPKSHEPVTVNVPIDLSTFLSIDPRQLNRNMAYLTSLTNSALLQPRRLAAKLTSTLWSYSSSLAAFIDAKCQWWNECLDGQVLIGQYSVNHWNFDLPKAFCYVSLVFALCSMLMFAQYSAFIKQPTHNPNLTAMNQTSLQTRQSAATLGLITVTPTAMSTGKTQKLVLTGTQIPTTHTEYLVSTVTKTIQLPTVAKLIPSDTLDFWLYKTDEGRLFLHSTKKLPKKWQPPKDWIEISQGNNRTTAVFTKFNESTYELHVNTDGTCNPLTVIMQPSRGQHAQKIFQLHDSNPCKPKRPWTAATQKLTAWCHAAPAELQSVSLAVTTKTKAVVGNARSTLEMEASRIGNITQSTLNRCNMALRAVSSWYPRMMHETPRVASFPSTVEAPPLVVKKSFKSFKNATLALQSMKTGISHSVKNIGRSTIAKCHNGVSSYLKIQRVVQASINSTVRTQLGTLRKDIYCTERIMGKNNSAMGMNFFDTMRNEFHCAKTILSTEMSEKFTEATWWSKNMFENLRRKVPHGPTSKPLKTARNRLLNLSSKMQTLEMGMRQKITDLVWRSEPLSPRSAEVCNKNLTVAQTPKAVWRHFLHL